VIPATFSTCEDRGLLGPMGTVGDGGKAGERYFSRGTVGAYIKLQRQRYDCMASDER